MDSIANPHFVSSYVTVPDIVTVNYRLPEAPVLHGRGDSLLLQCLWLFITPFHLDAYL